VLVDYIAAGTFSLRALVGGTERRRELAELANSSIPHRRDDRVRARLQRSSIPDERFELSGAFTRRCPLGRAACLRITWKQITEDSVLTFERMPLKRGTGNVRSANRTGP